ncbi:MAG: gamma-glutamyltransferase [Nocardioidaceae bacterium]|nr:gamma-glutamyltransferase [Nocardioidaceae bacterium]
MTIAQGQEPDADRGGMGGGLVPGLFPAPESMRPTLMGDRWAVVGGHPLVSQVAAEVLAAGGNAVDAGVAAGLASNVVQVDMASFGGIAPILVRSARDGRVHSVAGVGRWGASATLEAVRDRYGDSLPLGGAPCIVPGAPAAWIAALRNFGTWSFADAAAPAIELAESGFPLDHRTADNLRVMGAGFSQWASSRSVYWPQGRPPLPGERLRQPDLAALLRLLGDAESAAAGGRDAGLAAAYEAFYRGPVAERIASFVTEHGGFLDAQDLARYQAEVAPAPSVRFAGWDVAVTSGWSQGTVVAQALAILDGADLARDGYGSFAHLHPLVEALKLAFSDRELYLGDPDAGGASFDWLTGAERIEQLRALLGDSALPYAPSAGLAGPRLGSTTAVVVADADGNLFSTSPSDTLDGGPIIDGLGILCSPRGVQSRLVAGHPNVVAPGKRPCVTPAAVIAERGGPDGSNGSDGELLALACPGGDVIVQALAQVFVNLEVFGMRPQEAVEAARFAAFNFPSGFHPHPSAEGLLLVEDRIDASVRSALAAAGHEVQVWPGFEFDAGSVQVVRSEPAPDGTGRVLTAGADPRRSAYAITR